MYLEHLSLINFKNLEEVDLQLSPELNCFIGNNGAGKTNLMDAIYYMSFCKSFLNPIDQMNIRYGTDFFVISGTYSRSGQEEHVSLAVKNGQKKYVKRNKKAYRRLSEHIGLIPLVVITPSDIELITGGSEERRKFVDALISQYDPVYLDCLIRYNRALMQRNKLLKQFGGGGSFRSDTLEIWNEQLISHGTVIYEKRREYISRFHPVFQSYYELISQGREQTGLEYQSQLAEEDLGRLMADNLKKDLILQYTSSGIHKDDVMFSLGGHPMKRTGSQGQQKTYLIALKLAQFDFIKQFSGQTPILLLDDIFDKLDEHRVRAIVRLAASDHFGQIFITDTNREHLDQIIREVTTDSGIFTLDNGIVKETSHEKKQHGKDE